MSTPDRPTAPPAAISADLDNLEAMLLALSHLWRLGYAISVKSDGSGNFCCQVSKPGHGGSRIGPSPSVAIQRAWIMVQEQTAAALELQREPENQP